MKRNLTDLEQRLISTLRKDSRKSILDISKELGISRITAKKVMDNLTQNGTIRRFTITLGEDERNLVIVHLNDLKNVPEELIVEYFKLIDGTYLVVMFYENLMRIQELSIIDVKIATSRILNEDHGRTEHLKCDYCGREIARDAIRIEMQGRTYYACCPNCERDLKKRREFTTDYSPF